MRTTLRRVAVVTALAVGAVLVTGAGSVAMASNLPTPSYTLSNAGPSNCTVEASNSGEFVPALEIGVSGLGTGSHAVAAWTDDNGYVAATIDGDSGTLSLGSHAGTVTIIEVVEYTDASMTTVLSFLTGPASIVLSPCSGTQGWMGPYAGIASTPDGLGYWIASDGGFVFNYGDARFWGSFPYLASPPGSPQYRPVIGISSTSDGKGYWMAGYDGSVFAYGDAHLHGAMNSTHLNKPIVGMAASPDGKGYWLVASDGGIFAFGDAVLPWIDGRYAPQATDRGHDTGIRWSWVLDGGIRRRHLRLRRRVLPWIDGRYAPQSTDRRHGTRIEWCGLLDGGIRWRRLWIRRRSLRRRPLNRTFRQRRRPCLEHDPRGSNGLPTQCRPEGRSGRWPARPLPIQRVPGEPKGPQRFQMPSACPAVGSPEETAGPPGAVGRNRRATVRRSRLRR